MNLNLTAFFGILNKLKIDHLQTRSHAEHAALGIAYDALDDLFDKYIEHFYGHGGYPDTLTSYKITLSSYSGDLIPQYLKLKSEFVAYLQAISNDSGDLKNICDEIEGEFNHLIYRLNQK